MKRSYNLSNLIGFSEKHDSTVYRGLEKFNKKFKYSIQKGDKHTLPQECLFDARLHWKGFTKKENSNCKIISHTNQKGGVGKSTNAIHLTSIISKHHLKKGQKGLVVDCDPQGNISKKWCPEDHDLKAFQLYTLLEKIMHEEDITTEDIEKCIVKIDDNLFLLPSSQKLGRADELKAEDIGVLYQLLNMDYFQKTFSIISIDVVPTLSKLFLMAMIAADDILVPVQAEESAIEGTYETMRVINKLKKNGQIKVNILGFVVTMTNNTNLQQVEIEDIQETYGSLVFSSMIPRNTTLPEAYKMQSFLYDYDLSSNGTIAYYNLAEEIINRLNEGK